LRLSHLSKVDIISQNISRAFWYLVYFQRLSVSHRWTSKHSVAWYEQICLSKPV